MTRLVERCRRGNNTFHFTPRTSLQVVVSFRLALVSARSRYSIGREVPSSHSCRNRNPVCESNESVTTSYWPVACERVRISRFFNCISRLSTTPLSAGEERAKQADVSIAY